MSLFKKSARKSKRTADTSFAENLSQVLRDIRQGREQDMERRQTRSMTAARALRVEQTQERQTSNSLHSSGGRMTPPPAPHSTPECSSGQEPRFGR